MLKSISIKSKQNELTELPPGQQIPEFYSNAMTVNYSIYEFEISHILADSQGKLKGAINVRLSPQSAKSLLNILQTQIEGYEKSIGEIPVSA